MPQQKGGREVIESRAPEGSICRQEAGERLLIIPAFLPVSDWDKELIMTIILD